jgi:cell division inhibitor SulA
MGKSQKANFLEMRRFGFAEMNLLHQGNPAKTLELVKRAIRMGYDTVVINIDVGDLNPVEKANGEGDEVGL